jgi:hypothetical protein
VVAFDQLNRLHLDGVESYLANALGASDPTMDLTTPLRHDGGASVATFETDQYLPITILDANYVLKEIVYLTEYIEGASVGLKITRAQEGTDAFPHAKGNKVVHAATSEDFLSVLAHDHDPNAHLDNMKEIARIAAELVMAAHLNRTTNPNPHPQYALINDPNGTVTFEGDVVFNKNVTVKGTLLIPKGATLRVEGTLDVEAPVAGVIDGRLFVHDKQIVVSSVEPPTLLNTVWIQTFGA